MTQTARRLELAGGIAAAALATLGVLLLLVTPIVPYCTVSGAAPCPAADIRYTSLAGARPSTGVWFFLLAMVVATWAGAAGAFAEARLGLARGGLVLWGGALLAFAGCALGAGGIGLVFLPAVLALGLAAYASVLARRRPRPPRTP